MITPFEKFAKDYTVNTGEKVYMVRPTSSNNTPDHTVPIEQQESQDELWGKVLLLASRNTDYLQLLIELKKQFTITRKP